MSLYSSSAGLNQKAKTITLTYLLSLSEFRSKLQFTPSQDYGFTILSTPEHWYSIDKAPSSLFFIVSQSPGASSLLARLLNKAMLIVVDDAMEAEFNKKLESIQSPKLPVIKMEGSDYTILFSIFQQLIDLGSYEQILGREDFQAYLRSKFPGVANIETILNLKRPEEVILNVRDDVRLEVEGHKPSEYTNISKDKKTEALVPDEPKPVESVIAQIPEEFENIILSDEGDERSVEAIIDGADLESFMETERQNVKLVGQSCDVEVISPLTRVELTTLESTKIDVQRIPDEAFCDISPKEREPTALYQFSNLLIPETRALPPLKQEVTSGEEIINMLKREAEGRHSDTDSSMSDATTDIEDMSQFMIQVLNDLGDEIPFEWTEQVVSDEENEPRSSDHSALENHSFDHTIRGVHVIPTFPSVNENLNRVTKCHHYRGATSRSVKDFLRLCESMWRGVCDKKRACKMRAFSTVIGDMLSAYETGGAQSTIEYIGACLDGNSCETKSVNIIFPINATVAAALLDKMPNLNEESYTEDRSESVILGMWSIHPLRGAFSHERSLAESLVFQSEMRLVRTHFENILLTTHHGFQLIKSRLSEKGIVFTFARGLDV
nr:P7 protein [Grapevine Cabernet Sauvignon reovirus]